MELSKNDKNIQKKHNHQACVNHALSSAEAICQKKGVRLTAIRRRILELICSSHKAIGAYELLDLYNAEDAKAKPITIYRALDFLMDAKLVHKVESLNAFIGCLHAEKKHQSIILICDNCKNAYELEAGSVYQSIYEMSKKSQFIPSSLIIELHGICFSCV